MHGGRHSDCRCRRGKNGCAHRSHYRSDYRSSRDCSYGFGRQSYNGYFLLFANGTYKAIPGGATGRWSGGGGGITWQSGPYASFLGIVTRSSGRYRVVLKKQGSRDSLIATGPV